jgi:6-phosphofructokinase
MKKNALYIQSGGPTSVINASAYGVIQECKKHADTIEKLYSVRYGHVGLLNNNFIDLSDQDPVQLELLKQTPSMAFGSCRYRIPDETDNSSDYERILHNLKEKNIGYIIYNGGNGSVRACRDLGDYLKRHNYDCKLMVVPKTVDNDISHIDHSPGFPSAARHVVISLSELAHDIQSYDTPLIAVVEVMGRNSGFLAASAAAANLISPGVDLIYVPELVFNPDQFVQDVSSVMEQKGKCIAVVAEGMRTGDGKYLFEQSTINNSDDPYLNMGGVTPYLTRLLREHFDCKIRGIDLNLMQRCSVHTVSPIDVMEAEQLGRRAIQAMLNGESGKMVSIRRISNAPLRFEDVLVDLEDVVKYDNVLEIKYINGEANGINEEYLDYILPLLGELPRYAKLKL